MFSHYVFKHTIENLEPYFQTFMIHTMFIVTHSICVLIEKYGWPLKGPWKNYHSCFSSFSLFRLLSFLSFLSFPSFLPFLSSFLLWRLPFPGSTPLLGLRTTFFPSFPGSWTGSCPLGCFLWWSRTSTLCRLLSWWLASLWRFTPGLGPGLGPRPSSWAGHSGNVK